MTNAIIVVGLLTASIILSQITNRIRKPAALVRVLNLTAWLSVVVGAFIGWATFGTTGITGYAFDAFAIGAASALATRL